MRLHSHLHQQKARPGCRLTASHVQVQCRAAGQVNATVEDPLPPVVPVMHPHPTPVHPPQQDTEACVRHQGSLQWLCCTSVCHTCWHAQSALSQHSASQTTRLPGLTTMQPALASTIPELPPPPGDWAYTQLKHGPDAALVPTGLPDHTDVWFLMVHLRGGMYTTQACHIMHPPPAGAAAAPPSASPKHCPC
jgi:hypothetical protein